jgi:hypothetical protein
MNMKPLLSIAILFVTTILTAQDCIFYYPESEGAEMVYQQFDKKDKPTGKTVHKVTEYRTTTGGAEATIAFKTIDNKNEVTSESELTVRCEAGVFYFDMNSYLNQEMLSAYEEMEVKMEVTDLEMPSKLNVGQTLSDGSIKIEVFNAGFKLMTMEVQITDRKVEEKESVTTAAGIFTCFKISETVTARVPMKFVSKSIEWLSPGIGLIKSESFSSDGKPTGRTELVEFNK